MGLHKEISMTIVRYKIDDDFVVTQSFEWDGKKFSIGQKGTIKHIPYEETDDSGMDLRYYIEWDHEDRGFHDCGGYCPLYHGWCIAVNTLDDNSRLIYESKAVNPLPEDPRLRGIALKIVQLESKFKRYQDLKKSGQLHLLDEDNYEEEEDSYEDYDSNDYETVRG